MIDYMLAFVVVVFVALRLEEPGIVISTGQNRIALQRGARSLNNLFATSK